VARSTGLLVVRIMLCRQDEPLPLSRIVDMLRGCGAILAIVLSSLLADWISVGLRANQPTWSAMTPILIGSLGLVTFVAVAVAVEALWASRRLPHTGSSDTPAPDWFADPSR